MIRKIVLGLTVGGSAGRHTHPGVETGYVIEGEGELIIDGQPTKVLKPGESWAIPAGAIHDAKVVGDKPLKIMAIYIVEKDKPLATPAP
jgi:quercetin dioxygenase-like cupin family protein